MSDITREQLAALRELEQAASKERRGLTRPFTAQQAYRNALEKAAPALLAAAERAVVMREALLHITVAHGHVCREFEICRHDGCGDSSAAWMHADMALRGEPLPPECNALAPASTESVTPTEGQG